MAKNRELHPEFQAKMLNELASILNINVMEIPEVFRRAKPQALKLRIYDDMLARYPSVDPKKLHQWLGKWTGTRQYLMRIGYGSNRHDLDGNDFGVISDADREAARTRLQNMFEKWKARQAGKEERV